MCKESKKLKVKGKKSRLLRKAKVMSNISEVISKYDTILPSIVHLQPQIRVDGFTEEEIHLRQLVFSIPIQYAATARGILEGSGIQLIESKQYSHGRFEFILAQEQVNISKQ